ncbi:MAG TPA: LemA family protein [Bacteroidales bacterium]|jgi:LemA protein|nr:LemA family protein [Bacteroidales bacterium]MDI9574374.1 LemA family protein [Bacteroidota bacterium]OQC61693.1 MAG: LemA family protein [Bacteroidetes bacterium ADurb.Bin012]MBP9511332.1 LemA family protein [Bacteroidales bacterium]MBP9587854.1 LemA family protein [Bacteroidales bacterium]
MKKGLIIGLSIAIIVLIFILTGVSMYNSLVKAEENVNAQWANVENVYQRRADLIPNLVNTVKGYANFEQKTITDVIEARAKATSVNINPEKLNEASLQEFQNAQEQLSSALSRLMVVVERYPELKANQNFLELQSQLEGTENRIAVERRKFNEMAQAYNKSIRTFPRNIIANMFRFERKAYFEATEGAEQVPKVEF